MTFQNFQPVTSQQMCTLFPRHLLVREAPNQRLHRPSSDLPTLLLSWAPSKPCSSMQGPRVAPWVHDKGLLESASEGASPSLTYRGDTQEAEFKGTTLWVAYFYPGMTEAIGMGLGESTQTQVGWDEVGWGLQTPQFRKGWGRRSLIREGFVEEGNRDIP